ncbi:MAG: maleylpyruvate isomerase family mycothiol-dependent enzyme [Caldilineaceae bacterium]
MKPVEPIYTVELFPGASRALLDLLGELSDAEWGAPTACAGWTVRDVAAHLLGGNLGRLAAQRAELITHKMDGPQWQALFDLMAQTSRTIVPLSTFDALVAVINRFNAEWIDVAQSLDTAQLIAFLALTDPVLYQHFKALAPAAMTHIGVAWAGEAQSANWFDMAREYTEKWHHQQHIRDAVNRPGLTERCWLYPVLDTFMRALPHTYRNQSAPDGTVVNFEIAGEAGGEWALVRQGERWQLYAGSADNATATASLNQDVAWRLFTNGMSWDDARRQLKLTGDETLGAEILNMVSIMA